MKFTTKYLLCTIVLVLILSGCDQTKNVTRTELDAEWQFRQAGTEPWYNAEVPGVVHTDLLNNEMIPHPWKGTNELDVQWIENEDWEYIGTFTPTQKQLSRDHLDLVFAGLDTYAEVYLNDSLILNADNMFRAWRAPVRDLLRSGQNKLLIRFRSPLKVNAPKVEALPYQLPASNENAELKVSPFTRKAPYHFGWDWGPRLVTSGIWRPIRLEAWSDVRIADVQIKQVSLTDELAQLEAVLEIESDVAQDATVEVRSQTSTVKLTTGSNKLVIPLEIKNPKRWWPNGWGDPHLYNIPIALKTGKAGDEKEVKIGLRTVELVREKDSIGESFQFKVNGEPLFARGANYIPQSHFLPSVKKEDYEHIIMEAKAVGMNMLRVWGGGIYENDVFYELCDRHGILVWQDFMFACSMYPGDSAFVTNVEQEVIDNVKRLRNHPSIIHWNGNNEVDVAWKNWGWQKQYGFSKEDSTQIWNDYLDLFHERIPGIINELDDRPYTTTSPLSNWGTPENFNYASMHYWGVWHGGDEFEDYRKNVGRFMSEYGFQSFPNMETIKFFADSSGWSLDSEVMKHHQKSYIGNGEISRHVKKYFGQARDFEDFVEKSQDTQTKAMQVAIDAHRLNKGRCWGTLYWQLNDCWPGPSWSSLDVFGKRKRFHEELRTLYAPVALIPEFEGELLKVTMVNDLLEPYEGRMEVIWENRKDVIKRESVDVSCDANSLAVVFEMPIPNDEYIHSVIVNLSPDDDVEFKRIDYSSKVTTR